VSVQWARPELLLLLLPLALLLALAWRRGGGALPLPRGGALAASGGLALLARLPALLRGGVLILLVLTLAGPRTAGAVVEEEFHGVPIVVTLDISSSMLARDMGGGADRLETARTATARFIRERAGDPIALVAFAGEAITLVPLTMQRRVLQGALDQLTIGLLEDGTAIGEGLAIAIARLRAVEAESRVVVLMSDGENNRGVVQPLDAAAAAAALGIQVFTIGVGSEAGGAAVTQVPGLERMEQPGGLDEALLRRIAEMTGGSYFRVTDAGALDRVFAEIDRLVASPIQAQRREQVREWHAHLLLLGAALLLLEWGARASRWGVLP
jgi:Ca-activated chloride channel homolog